MSPPLLTYILLLAEIINGSSFVIRYCEVHGQYHPKVLCYNKHLTHVPKQLPKQTISLDLAHNNIESLKTSDFNNLTAMHELNVSANRINHIETGTFQKLSGLKLLNLSSNRIDSLMNGMFEGLKNLSILLLNNNPIVTIDPKAFSGLTKLKSLGLSSNHLQELKNMDPAFQIHSLEELYIANSSLQTFSTNDIVKVYASLHTIDVSKNPLSFINFTSNILQNLTSLDISFSQKSVSLVIKEPCFLRLLKRLNIEGNQVSPIAISSLIQSLSCCSLEEINLGYLDLTDSDHLIEQICFRHPKLQILQLQGNNYKTFKVNTFQNCTMLKWLDLSDNHFQQVTASSFQHLNSLKVLSLANNKLTKLPADLSPMTSLERLNLSNNHVSKVFLNHSKSYDKLKHLDLSRNKMSVFFSSSLGNWSLQYLNLGENYILDISESFATSLGMLQMLLLRKNKLSYITTNTFKNLNFLTHLNLVDNQIEVIDPGAYIGLDNLQTLLLGSNKITSNVLQKHIFEGLESLLELQLFSNYLNYDSSKELEIPPFMHLKSLKLITLNSQGHNGMLNLPVNFFEGLVALEKIHAGNLALSGIDQRTFFFIPQLKELDLSSNPLQSLDPCLLQHVPNLTELHISLTKIESLDFLITSNNTELSLLRAVGSQLNTFTSKQLEALPSLRFLDLRNNPLTCSCENQWFIEWVQSDMKTQVLHFYEYGCAYPPSTKGLKLFTFNVYYCRQDYAFILFLTTTLLISNLLILLTVWNFWRWQVVYAYYIALAFLYDRKQKGRKQKYLYDAFISYNCHDEEWVFNQLVPNLEENYRWKLCLHHRDFEPGKAILDNIVDGIYSSRKTICIISRHYLESEWCSKEIQVASYRLFDEHADVLILLFLEDIPSHRLSPYHQMRKLIKRKTYLIWPKDTNAASLFWYKVNQALHNEERQEEEHCLLSGVCP
ncbi:uncharacterized protein WCC33_006203 [Rhinophrynus dorsalis]